jgi:hypothetical protein
VTGRQPDAGGDEQPRLRIVPDPDRDADTEPDARSEGHSGTEPNTDAGTSEETETENDAYDEVDDELIELVLGDVPGGDLEFLLVPLLTEAERQMRSIRRPLDAEMWATELLGMLDLGAPDESTPEEREAVTLNLATRLVEYAVEQNSLSGLAMLRTLSVIGPQESRLLARKAASRTGLRDRSWAAAVGRPDVRRCWRFRDAEGIQESVTVVFGYGTREHTLTVLIDQELGGGVKDCWISEDPDGVLAETRAALEPDDIEIEFISAGQARTSLQNAVGRAECPQTPDEVEDLALCRAFLQARVDLLISTCT